MSIILTRHVGTASASGAGAFTQDEKLALELYMAFKAAQLSHYVEFTYTAKDLTNITIYEDDTKAVTLFIKDFAYSPSKDLESILTTRVSDGAQLLRLFTYDVSKDLVSIEVSAGP